MTTRRTSRRRALANAGINTGFDATNYVATENAGDNVTAEIYASGYVKNTKLWRRWITAQTFRMMNSRLGWNGCLNKLPYMYQFEMLKDELKALYHLEREDEEAFRERTHFFNKRVVAYTVSDYLNKLLAYVAKNMKREKRSYIYIGRYYLPVGTIKLAKKGTITRDQFKEYYDELNAIYERINGAENYRELYDAFMEFKGKMNKLPCDTPKCGAWKDAFKGSGAYYTLKNLVMFHDIQLQNYLTGEVYPTATANVEFLNGLLEDYEDEGWRFHELLKATVERTHFDLSRSISEHSNR